MHTIRVSVVYALPDRATEVALTLPAGATLGEALVRSGLAARHPELDLARCPVGIFGRRYGRQKALADGDRIEIYRPLVAEPKDARRRRAQRSAPEARKQVRDR
jgi:putative ubiquitin-RnfH superfamily antitoxin RatB of RatAB toxin-antitoxin module